MKILFNKLDEFLEMKKNYYEGLREIYANKRKKHRDIYLKLLKQKYSKNCQEIADKELKEGTNEWLTAKSYFSHPYFISIWNNDEDKDKKFIKWEEKIMNISIKKLSKILENSDKKYLELSCNMGICMWMKPIVKLEKED